MITRDCISLFERRGSPPRSKVATPKPSTVRVPSIASTSRTVRKTVIRRLWSFRLSGARGHLLRLGGVDRTLPADRVIHAILSAFTFTHETRNLLAGGSRLSRDQRPLTCCHGWPAAP